MKTLLVDGRILMYEQDLPEMTDEQYREWFKTSILVDSVRMGSLYPDSLKANMLLKELGRVAMKSLTLPKLLFGETKPMTENEQNAANEALKKNSTDYPSIEGMF